MHYADRSGRISLLFKDTALAVFFKNQKESVDIVEFCQQTEKALIILHYGKQMPKQTTDMNRLFQTFTILLRPIYKGNGDTFKGNISDMEPFTFLLNGG